MHLKIFAGADAGAVTADFDQYRSSHALVDQQTYEDNEDVEYRPGQELLPQRPSFTQEAPEGGVFVIVARFST
ncbi:MAG: hypothetical protein JWR84_3774 [Caulobacter sp.]|nr:hypothetical protein [Caulobacter sp.]